MQLVDKKNRKCIFIISVLTLFFIMGCSSKNEYTNSVKYYDNNITKDQLLDAAKKVFHLSDKDDFVIDAYRDELNVTKSQAVYSIYTMKIRNDHFDFKVDENTTNKRLNASLALSRTYGIDEDEIYYVEQDNKVYELFWSRVDYLLGLSDDWESCAFYHTNGFLCDLLELDDTTATKKDLIDLNTTDIDSNATLETIEITTSYNPSKKNEDDYTVTNIINLENPNEIAKSNNKDTNATFDSYTIIKEEYLDKNTTKKVHKVLKKNNDNNETNE